MFFPKSVEKLTVPEAIRVGRVRIQYVVFFLFFLLQYGHIPLKNQVWWVQTGYFVGAVFAIFGYWSVAASRWRVWAFSQVADIWTLHRTAVDEKIITDYQRPEWYKYEWKTAEQRAFWAGIERQLEREDVPEILENDFAVPDETQIFYTKSDWWAGALVLLVLSLGAFFSFQNYFSQEPLGKKERALPFLMLGVLIFTGKYLLNLFRRLFIWRHPLITMNRNGLFLHEKKPIAWSEIGRVEVRTFGSGDSEQKILFLGFPRKTFFRKEKTMVADEEGEDFEDWDFVEISKNEFDTLPEADRWLDDTGDFLEINLENYGMAPAEIEYRLKTYLHRHRRN